MNYKELEYFASTCQMAADEIASKLITQQEIFSNISIFQSSCEFNLYWLYQISPEVVLHFNSIAFLCKYKDEFNRKISIKEILRFDEIIEHLDVKTFEDFKLYLNKRQKPKTMI